MIPEIASKPLPTWLADATDPLGYLPIRDVLTDSVYYPACGFDCNPVRYLAGNFSSFVYVDYGVGREALIENIHGFRGYRVAARRDVTERELTPDGWTPQPPQCADGNPQVRTDWVKAPFGVWAIQERAEGYGPEHGPERFSLLYIGGDGVATFQALYLGNRVAPAVVAVIQPGHGFGGNWTNFEDPDRLFARSVLGNPAGVPEYLLFGGRGNEKFYRSPCWPAYPQLVRVLRHGRLRLWRRNAEQVAATDRPRE